MVGEEGLGVVSMQGGRGVGWDRFRGELLLFLA